MNQPTLPCLASHSPISSAIDPSTTQASHLLASLFSNTSIIFFRETKVFLLRLNCETSCRAWSKEISGASAPFFVNHHPQCNQNTLKDRFEFIQHMYVGNVVGHSSCPYWPWSDNFVMWLHCKRWGCVSSSWKLHVGLLLVFCSGNKSTCDCHDAVDCFKKTQKGNFVLKRL